MRAEVAALELRRLSWRRARRGAASVWGEFAKYDLLTYSSAIAFQGLYVVVPIVLLGLAALGLVGETSLYTHHVAPTLRRDLSHDAYAVVNRTALRVMRRERGFWLTFGLVVTLWGVGAALRSMMTPLNGIYGAKEDRSWLGRIAISIGGGALVLLCVYATIVVVLVGRLINATGVLDVAIGVGRWLVALALLLLANALLIRFVPAKRRPLQWVSIGSILVAICWVVATIGFGAYISAVSYSSFYGALAGVVLLLIYLHVSAIAFLLGVVVDALLREEIRRRERRR
ncbi:MAG TPA: YhjD/YihY/BrkB family envelope integrity protein [Gaiellaceae bacterium]|nr:YhjD/YihY/BrkB family envelope integrity protein [Gaiellaceae bacterium]